MKLLSKQDARKAYESLYGSLEARISATPQGMCPVDFTSALVRLCGAQSCGKCIPCRVGLRRLDNLLEAVLYGEADLDTIDLIEKTARDIYSSADCAIGYGAAGVVLQNIKAFRDDFESHALHDECLRSFEDPVPCVSGCPAAVDVPGYIALVQAGRYADAVRLVMKDNPFPLACGLICEHPCEEYCRRGLVDDVINIRGIKRYAVDHAEELTIPAKAEATGKRVAVIGGGPAGLTAAYYLALMGHDVRVFEQRPELGGMLRYGIPNYRLPKDQLDKEIDLILSAGVKVEKSSSINTPEDIKKLEAEYDAVFVAIGAHGDNKMGIDGEDAIGVLPAVSMLRDIGENNAPDFSGKRIVVVGGGNVAMDAARSSVRLGASNVTVVYRRRIVDMTAQVEEVQGAIAEGCEIAELCAPVRVEKDEHGKVAGIWVQPQIIGAIENGRAKPEKADEPEYLIDCDIIVVAIGQKIDSAAFGESGIALNRGMFVVDESCAIRGSEALYAGGDCATGPTTVIRAIAAGKVVAYNIDRLLGFKHEIPIDIDIPVALAKDDTPCARIQMSERDVMDRKDDFELMEYGMSSQEAAQECGRCLRCDHFGYAAFRGGRA